MIVAVNNKVQQQIVIDFYNIQNNCDKSTEEYRHFIILKEDEIVLTNNISSLQKHGEDDTVHTFEEFVCFILGNYRLLKETNDPANIFRLVFDL
jgi:hypothetical protein